MTTKVIGKRIIEGEEYQMEVRGEKQGFHHLQSGFFYAIKAINRGRLEIDAYFEDEYDHSFDCKQTKMLGELLVDDIHKHLRH